MSLLDRLAGTSGIAAEFGAGVARLEQVRAELRALDELGDEADRDDLQDMVDKVWIPNFSWLVRSFAL